MKEFKVNIPFRCLFDEKQYFGFVDEDSLPNVPAVHGTEAKVKAALKKGILDRIAENAAIAGHAHEILVMGGTEAGLGEPTVLVGNFNGLNWQYRFYGLGRDGASCHGFHSKGGTRRRNGAPLAADRRGRHFLERGTQADSAKSRLTIR